MKSYVLVSDRILQRCKQSMYYAYSGRTSTGYTDIFTMNDDNNVHVDLMLKLYFIYENDNAGQFDTNTSNML